MAHDIRTLAEQFPVSSDSDSEVELVDGRASSALIHHDPCLESTPDDDDAFDEVLQEPGLTNVLCSAPRRARRESMLEGVVSGALDELFQQRGLFRGRDQVFEAVDNQPRRGRERLGIGNLPMHRITEQEVTSAAPENCACAVCMEEFKGGEMLSTLPCFHRFHRKCVERWLKQTPSCPTCKYELEVKTPVLSLRRDTAGARRRSRSLRRRSPSPVVLSVG